MRAALRVFLVAAAVTVAAATPAAGKPLRVTGKVSVADGIIGDGFALDERGARLAYVVTDAKGTTRLHVGPADGGGAARARKTDLTRFSSSPERVVSVGSGWFVIASEAKRRAVAVGPNGALGRETGSFTEGFVSAARRAGPVFVTVTDRGERADGHGFEIAAFGPGGNMAGRKTLVLAADGTIAGTPGLAFQAFTGGYLAVLVRRAGRYDARADARTPTEIATYDVLSGAISGARRLGDPKRFEKVVLKRNEKPGVEAFVRFNDAADGLELIGPDEKLRPLALPGKFAHYDHATLEQQQTGGRLYLAMVLDPATTGDPETGKAGAGAAAGPALHVFEVALGPGRAVPVGEIPLGAEKQGYTWVAGGTKVAFMRKGGNEVLIYER